MDYWNLKNLERPAGCSFKADNENIDLESLHNLIKGSLLQLSDDTLPTEAALISRSIYRMKQKFRKDKGLKGLEKTNRALKQYLHLNVSQVLESFLEALPQKYGRDTYLPTRNLLDFVLLKLQGLSKLCVRTADACKETALYMENKIALGQFWKVAMIILAAVSRVWMLMKNVAEICCKIYQAMLDERDKFENRSDWIGEICFPVNLMQWSGAEETFKDKPVEIKKEKLYISSVDDDSDMETEILHQELDKIKEERCSDTEKTSASYQNIGSKKLDAKVDEDLGESLARNEFKPRNSLSVKSGKNKEGSKIKREISKKVVRDIINNLHNMEQIKQFMSQENTRRQRDQNECIYKSLGDNHWKKLMKYVKKHAVVNDSDSISSIKKMLQTLFK